VLWINQHQRGDYMRDQLMVGMRHLVGANMVDWVKVLPRFPPGYMDGYGPHVRSTCTRIYMYMNGRRGA
jgi:hypothetical protein